MQADESADCVVHGGLFGRFPRQAHGGLPQYDGGVLVAELTALSPSPDHDEAEKEKVAGTWRRPNWLHSLRLKNKSDGSVVYRQGTGLRDWRFHRPSWSKRV